MIPRLAALPEVEPASVQPSHGSPRIDADFPASALTSVTADASTLTDAAAATAATNRSAREESSSKPQKISTTRARLSDHAQLADSFSLGEGTRGLTPFLAHHGPICASGLTGIDNLSVQCEFERRSE